MVLRNRLSARNSNLKSIMVIRAGFTMIELLVAISIFGAVALVLFSTAGVFTRGKNLLDDRRQLELLSEQVFLKLMSDVKESYSGGIHRLINSQSSQQGQNNSLPSVFRLIPSRGGSTDEDGSGGENDYDTLSFILDRGGQFIPGQISYQGPVQVTYRLAEDDQSPTGYSLVREELPLPVSNVPSNQQLSGGEQRMVFPITDQIRSFRCRLFKRDKGWFATWGDIPERGNREIPDLVEFQITLDSIQGEGADAGKRRSSRSLRRSLVFTYTTAVALD